MDSEKDYWNDFYHSGDILSYLSYKEQSRRNDGRNSSTGYNAKQS